MKQQQGWQDLNAKRDTYDCILYESQIQGEKINSFALY